MTLLIATMLSLTWIALFKRHGALHPATLLCLVSTGTLTVAGTLGRALGLAQPSINALLIYGLGNLAFSAPALIGPGTRGRVDGEQVTLRRTALGSTTIIVALLVLVGLWSFRSVIAADAGVDFGQLTFTEVRQYQTALDRSGGGALGLLYSLTPLAATLVLMCGSFLSRAWLLGLLPVSYVVVQSPARTVTLATVSIASVFVLLLRRSQTTRLRSPRSRSRVEWLSITLVLCAVLAYFMTVARLLGKDRVNQLLTAPEWLPHELVSPVLYLTGGLSAWSTAMEYSYEVGEWGRSVYSFLRLGEFLGLGRAPETITQPVPIPVPYNVFTAFGDLWFDFGLFGTAGLVFILGFFAHLAYRRAVSGSLAMMWLSACLGSLVLSSFFAFRAFYLDSVFLAGVGMIAMRSIQRLAPESPTSDRAARELTGNAVPHTPASVLPSGAPRE